jgi:prevent-host-death family protein
MSEVNVTELRRNLPEYLADVKKGKELKITVHGKVIARGLRVLPISPEIAVLAQSEQFTHGDPADRIIAATAMHFNAKLVSADAQIRTLKSVEVVW